jgi:hypothetical protein
MKGKGGLPDSPWTSYSSLANSYGRVILLGAKENADKSLNIIGLKDPDGYIKILWDAVNNRQKTSVNILSDKNLSG